MTTLFSVKNDTGETWPAYGLARLGAVLSYDGVNSDVPLYELLKPDGEDGIYVVNGASPLEDEDEGSGIHYLYAGYVFVDDEVVGVSDVIGAVADKWNGVVDSPLAQFRCTDEKNGDTDIAPVIPLSSGGGSSSSTTCPCVCLDRGDVFVNDIETTSRWSVAMTTQTFHQIYGDIIFPGGTHILVLDPEEGTWSKDIGDILTARYPDDSDATEDTTMDGTLTMSFDEDGKPIVSLCVDGEVPELVEEEE
jgi:hypothetical protein